MIPVSVGNPPPGAKVDQWVVQAFRKVEVASRQTDNDLLALLSGIGAMIVIGTGSPQSVVTAPVGTLFLRTNGGAGTSLYVKESGTGNTGWVGK